jgi:hypothetical protein
MNTLLRMSPLVLLAQVCNLLSCVHIYSNFGEAVAPPWFSPVQQQLNRIEASSAIVSPINLFKTVCFHMPIYNS